MDTDLLPLMWLASPALPVGGFSYSEGLEAAVEWAGVHDEANAGDWIDQQLQLSQARGDMAVLAQAMQAWHSDERGRLVALNAWVLQTRESSELRLQTEQMGRSLLAWLRSLAPHPADPLRTAWEQAGGGDLAYPVAFALAAASTQAPVSACTLCYGFAWAENMVQAALRAVPLGQSAGQRILARLVQALPGAAQQAMDLPAGQRQSFTPMLAILSARHETQYSRLFRS